MRGIEGSRPPSGQGLAALQDFDPAYRRFGSFASNRPAPNARGMSAIILIAPKFVRRG
jgi:hypothetical protein